MRNLPFARGRPSFCRSGVYDYGARSRTERSAPLDTRVITSRVPFAARVAGFPSRHAAGLGSGPPPGGSRALTTSKRSADSRHRMSTTRVLGVCPSPWRRTSCRACPSASPPAWAFSAVAHSGKPRELLVVSCAPRECGAVGGARGGAGQGGTAQHARASAAAAPPPTHRQLHVLGHDGDALAVDGAEVRVLEEPHEVRLSGLLGGARGWRRVLQARHARARGPWRGHTPRGRNDGCWQHPRRRRFSRRHRDCRRRRPRRRRPRCAPAARGAPWTGSASQP